MEENTDDTGRPMRTGGSAHVPPVAKSKREKLIDIFICDADAPYDPEPAPITGEQLRAVRGLTEIPDANGVVWRDTAVHHAILRAAATLEKHERLRLILVRALLRRARETRA